MKILWVDDQIKAAGTFAGLLQSRGHFVTLSADAEKALELIKSNAFDVILADLRMPPTEWGGLWLLEKLKDASNPVPVIVVSGEGAQLETIQALRLGAIDYITKDRIQQELISRVEACESSAKIGELQNLLSGGEGHHVEFKSTLRYNLAAKKSDPAIELSALKSIAAFLNADGGTLLIGVSDEGNVLGLDNDQFPNLDKFQLHFWNLIREKIGAEFSNSIHARVASDADRTFFRIDCKKSGTPVFIKWKFPNDAQQQELFFVRAGPQTEQLTTRRAVAYIRDHFVNS